MKRWEMVLGIAAFAIMLVVGGWILVMRFLKKQEPTKQQRMVAGMGLAVALSLFFAAMPVNVWIRVLGVGLAVIMFFSSLYQWDPKLPERMRNRGKSEEGKAHRTAAEDYMPYYKRKQIKQRRK